MELEVKKNNKTNEQLLNEITLLKAKITQLEKSEAERKRAEEKFRIIFESAPDAYYLSDLKGKFIDGNKAAERITGYRKEELIGKSFLKLNMLHKNQFPRAATLLAKNALGKPTGPDELTLIRKDHSKIEVEIATYPVKIEGKTLVLGIARDITERKLAEKKLIETNEKLKTSIDNMPNAYILCDTETLVLEWNRAAEKIFGYSKEEMLGKNLIEFIVPEKVRHLVREAINKLKLGEVSDYSEKDNNIRKDGKLISCQWFNTPLADENGKVFGILLIAQDVTKQLQAEDKIRESQQRLSSHLQNTPLGAIFWDVNMKVTDWNKSAERIFGYSKEEAVGKHANELIIPKEIRDRMGDVFNQLLTKTGGKKNTNENTTKEGKRILCDWYNVGLTDSNGKVSGVASLVDDITEKRDIKENLQSQRDFNETLIQTTSAFFVAIKGNGRVLMMNDTMLKALGYSKQEVLGKDYLTTFVPESDREMLSKTFEKLISLPQPTLNENYILAKDGHKLLVEWHGASIIKDKKFDYFIGLGIDITERKQIEEKIEDYINRLKKAQDIASLGFLDWDLKTDNIFLSDEAYKIYGLSPKDVEKTPQLISKCVHPDDLELVQKNLELTKKGFQKYDIDHRIIRPDGEIIWVNAQAELTYDYENNPTTLLGTILDITERKKAEEKLKESESKYRTLFENNLAGVYLSTIAGKILDCNDAFVRILGYSSKEDVLKTDANNFHKNKKERKIFIQNLKTKKELLNFESKAKKKDGSLIYTIENVQLIGENILQGTIVEITELKRTEEALKTTIEFNESLIDTIPFGLDIVDMEGNILFMNDVLKDAVGQENPKGKCWEFYKDDKKQCTECPLKDEMELGEIRISETNNVFGGREYEVTHTVMNYKNQKAMLEIFRDITEAKRAEKEILKLSRGVEQSPAMVVITDLDGNIEFVNPKVTEVTGYSPKELIGKNSSTFQSSKTPKKTYKELWDTILKGDTWEGELLNKRKTGEEYWESERISPIFNDKGETINYIAIREDITESIQARNDLLEAKEKAEEANRIKSIFLANMSHELRTPMVGIIGFTEILEDEIEKPELKEYATFIHEGANRLMESLNLILNLTKIEAEKLNIELSKIDVIKNIKKNISTFDKMAANKNIYLKFESDIEQFETETDERMFDQIICNLVNNAVKYTEVGGVTVSVDKVKNNSYLKIKVKDTGIGIPEDKQDIIWEEFRQVSEGDSRTFEGTGLGLTITNNFVNQLGGEIKLKSELGEGSTFTVLLPIREKSTSTKTKGPPIDKTTDRLKTKDTQEELKTLLYVDDDKISREVVKRFLRGAYKLDLAPNGKEGLKKAKKKKYDGMLMDINLKSKMDGRKAAEKIKEMEGYKDVPIIAITAYAMVGDREKYLQAGFTDYISKPFFKNDLIELLDKTIK